MPGTTTLRFDHQESDFIVAGTPLLSLLGRHEGIRPDMYQPAVGVIPMARERLLMTATPDLTDKHVALYVCGHCGDYDGIAIGAIISGDAECISWQEIGWFDEADDLWRTNITVTRFDFLREEYLRAIACAPSS